MTWAGENKTKVVYLSQSDIIRDGNMEFLCVYPEYYKEADKLKPRCLRVYLTSDFKIVTAGGFNLYALLFSWIYFIYKKMYIIGIPGLLLAGILILVQPVILIIYAALSMILSGIFFNKIFLWFANKKIDKIINNHSPEEAIKIAIEAKQISVSFLQRRLRIGFNRASRIVDELEQMKVIGPRDGVKAREVLIRNIEELKISN